MPRLTERVKELELKLKRLENKIRDMSKHTENTTTRPYSKSGGVKDPSQVRPSDIETGLGATFGGNFIWNDAELLFPPYGQQPSTPIKGYNKHGHSRYAGGALDIHILELVEYETNDDEEIIDSNGKVLNKHSQGFWKTKPNIKKDGEVPKIGLLDIAFDRDSKKWVAGANYIDVERTYLVQYIWTKDGEEVDPDTEGATREIKTDENGNEMKSPLFNNMVWDKIGKYWRFYAVFRPYEPEG